MDSLPARSHASDDDSHQDPRMKSFETSQMSSNHGHVREGISNPCNARVHAHSASNKIGSDVKSNSKTLLRLAGRPMCSIASKPESKALYGGGLSKRPTNMSSSYIKSVKDREKFGRSPGNCSLKKKEGDSVEKDKELVRSSELIHSQDELPANSVCKETEVSASKESSTWQPKSKKFLLDYEKLKDLVMKSDSEILLSLASPGSGLEQCLNSVKTSREVMANLLIAIGKACGSCHRNKVVSFVDTVTQNKRFMFCSIQQYLGGFQKFEIKSHHKESLLMMLNFLQCYQQCLPASASETIAVIMPLFRVTCLDAFQGENSLLEEVMQKVDGMSTENVRFLEDRTQSDVQKTSRNERLNLLQPPENYRSIPVLPDAKDVYLHKPFLRPNIVAGKYVDADHYLDVQFRLLREDYVRPLREGINYYLLQKNQKKKTVNYIKNFRIYKNVFVIDYEFYRGLLIHTVKLDKNKLRHVEWHASKRFLSNSLVCLSSNDFQTMYFASVVFRDPVELKVGFLYLHFEEISTEVLNFDPSTPFVVLETSAFFEAYRHNLRALQDMSAEDFPFQKYIIKLEKETRAPAYLQPSSKYDMTCLLSDRGKQSHLKFCKGMAEVEVLDITKWPSAVDLGLDTSQYEALQFAITKELAIIQGPPGTGKTYIGLKIVQFLLKNWVRNFISDWGFFFKRRETTKILIICYTNHALDQFLDGISVFTESIARVGGRCTNEALEKFSLKNLKSSFREKKLFPEHLHRNLRDAYDEINALEEELKFVQNKISKCYTMVLSETMLVKHMSNRHYLALKSIVGKKYQMDDGYLIADWLDLRFRSLDCIMMPNKCHSSDENENGDEGEKDGDKKEESNNKPVGLINNHIDIENEEDIDAVEAMRDVETEDYSEFLHKKHANEKFARADNNRDSLAFKDYSEWKQKHGKKNRKKNFLHKFKKCRPMTSAEARNVKSVLDLGMPDRLRLYKFWVEEFVKAAQQRCVKIHNLLCTKIEKLEELRLEEDLYVLQDTRIVGVTTTGAAKYRNLMVGLQPKVIIVEEAAEILESHVVTSLMGSTQHLILIGDHQQLRPNPTVYELAVKFNMNVSLFERLIKNGMNFCQLKLQHRMRPCISSLLVPHIYPTLLNHDSVYNYENIKGVFKNMYFIEHSFMEDQMADSTSKVNLHEASFLAQLCRYLLLQGYLASQITILTTYAGQMFAIRDLTRAPLFKNLRVTVVDNFQGEESDIILISFVRSNDEGNVGFLKTSNRVCVALSRAKKGLFCVGNFRFLAKNCELWKRVIEKLLEQEAIGPSLKLQCQNHPDTFFEVSEENDFSNVRDGGCSEPCSYRLQCGHKCELMCHPYDQQHKEIQCLKNCERILCELGHQCPLKCYKTCLPCMVEIEIELPKCAHKVSVPCYVPKNEVVCPEPCPKYLSCGHKCPEICGNPCPSICVKLIEIILPCSHSRLTVCDSSLETACLMNTCKTPCNTKLQCGHLCAGTCEECKQGRIHIACLQSCAKTLICGHKCESYCARVCPPCKKTPQSVCGHNLIAQRCGDPRLICAQPCLWKCEHYECGNLCGELCDTPPCGNPCKKVLLCGHQCSGLCGEERCPSLCIECNPEVEVSVGGVNKEDARYIQLDCGHIFEVDHLAQWMIENNKSTTQEICMKACVKCGSVVRRCAYFHNTIKANLASIEGVKQFAIGDQEKNWDDQQKLLSEIKELLVFSSQIDSHFLGALKSLLHAVRLQKPLKAFEIIRYNDALNIAKAFSTSHAKLAKLQCADATSHSESLDDCYKKLMSFAMSTQHIIEEFIADEILTASELQLEDVTWELHRLILLCNFLNFLMDSLTLRESNDDLSCLNEISLSLCKVGPFGLAEEERFYSAFQSLAEAIGKTAFDDLEVERKLTLKAVNFAQRQWFLCANEHIFYIKQNNGSTREIICNKCDVIDVTSNDVSVPNSEMSNEFIRAEANDIARECI